MVSTVPSAIAATWPPPNYVNPVTRGLALFVVNVVFVAFTTPVVMLRIWTRWHMRRRLGWDDLWCVIAFGCAIWLSVGTILACNRYGADRHLWDVEINDLEVVLKLAMMCKAVFACSGTAVRQSLLCFYQRLIDEACLKGYRWALYGATFLNIALGIGFVLLSIFQCTPVSTYWKYPNELYGHCLDDGTTTIVCGGIVIAFDITVVLLPIPLVLRLQMSRRQKIGVIILFTLGLTASAAAAARTYFTWKALVQTYDATWYVYPLWVAATLELYIAILAACGPGVRPFVVKYFPIVLSTFIKLHKAMSFGRSMGDSSMSLQSSVTLDDMKGDSRSTEPTLINNHSSTIWDRKMTKGGFAEIEPGDRDVERDDFFLRSQGAESQAETRADQ